MIGNLAKNTQKAVELVSPRLQEYLFRNNKIEQKVYGKALNEKSDDISTQLELPRLHAEIQNNAGNEGVLMKHFRREASIQFERYGELLESAKAMQRPPRPEKWSTHFGWTAYDGQSAVPQKISFPEERLLFFDVEVCMKDGRLPTLAVALSPTKWYSWCSERMANDRFELPELVRPEHLIPLGDLGQLERIVIGHNVAFDRTFIREQYFRELSAMRFWDTMSMHIAIAGMADHQRDLFKHSDDLQALAKLFFARYGDSEEIKKFAVDLLTMSQKSQLNQFMQLVKAWKDKTCKNSLEAVYEKYCKNASLSIKKNSDSDAVEKENNITPKNQIEWDKTYQNTFKTANIEYIRENAQILYNYCASDVQATQEVFQSIYGSFQHRFTHPVTYCGMLEMGNPYLPVTANWRHFYTKCESESSEKKDGTTRNFLQCTRKLLDDLDTLSENGLRKFELDPWMWVSDWNRPPKRPQWPEWYYGLFKKFQDANVSINDLPADRVKMLSRDIPRIFGLCYGPYPLYHKFSLGWGFLVPNDNYSPDDLPEVEQVLLRRGEHVNFPVKAIHELITRNKCHVSDVLHGKMRPISTLTQYFGFYRLPHQSGKITNVGTPFDKSSYKNYEENVLYATRFEKELKDFLNSRSVTRFWGNYRNRYKEELAVWLDEHGQLGAIVPSIVPAGTVTRRATHKLWLTSSNIKQEVIGSDLKSMVQCSDGWKLVGADVDSQEQWLAALFGDALLEKRQAGGTAFSNMLLAGNKMDASDLHSVVGRVVGISRDQAKQLNYARLYGSGHLHAEQFMLKQGIPQVRAKELTRKLFNTTKGQTATYQKMTETGAKMLDKFISSNKSSNSLQTKDDVNIKRIDGNYFLLDSSRIKSNNSLMNRFEEWMLNIWENQPNNSKMGVSVNGREDLALLRKKLYNGKVKLYTGGFESYTFNWLELNSSEAHPCTPVLNCRLSKALEPFRSEGYKDFDQATLDKFNGLFKRTIVNWFVQSSAVDFLHLLLVCMRWLCREYKIPARYVISIHDEVRYLVPEEHKWRCALALSMSNMYVRAAITEALGIQELPKSIAFFSQIDIDSVLRKEVNLECRNPDGNPIEKGEAVTIEQIIEKTGGRLTKE